MLNQRKSRSGKCFAQRGVSFPRREQNKMEKKRKEDLKVFSNMNFAQVLGVVLAIGTMSAAAVVIIWSAVKKGRPDNRRAIVEPLPEPEKRREELVQKVIQTHRQMLEMSPLRLYAKLFQDLALPLQQLLGIAALGDPAPAWATPERLQDIVQENITGEVRGILRRGGAQQVNGRTVFPAQPRTELPEDYVSRVQQANMDQLRQSLRQDQAAIEDERPWVEQKRVVEGLDWLLEELEVLAAGERYDPQATARTAQRVQNSLERCGIYPMFCRDQRLAAQPELREDFGYISALQLEYPGLFIQSNGRWKTFSGLAGTAERSDQ